MIVLAVAIAVATFTSALVLRASVRDTAIASYRALSGECELEATLSEEYSTYYLTADSGMYRTLETHAAKYGALHAGYDFFASVGTKGQGAFAEVYATDISELAAYNAVTFLSGGYSGQTTGIVLSDTFAEKIGAQVNDYLYVSRYGSGSELPVKVEGIAATAGVFRQVDALLTEEGASRVLSLGDIKVYNRFFIDLSEQKMSSLGVDTAEVQALIEDANPLFILASPVAEGEVQVTLSYQSTLLFVIAVIAAALGAILIYTSVSLVMKNRVATASLFKSVGATSGALSLYLLAEVLLYAMVGALVGLGAGYGVQALFGYLTGTVVTFSLGWLTALVGVLFGVALALLSALLPVLRLSHSPLYDMLHEASPVRPVRSLPVSLCGALFLALFVAAALVGTEQAFLVGAFAFFALLFSLFTLVPLALKGVATLVSLLTKDRPAAGKLYLAAAGARHDRHVHSGARLLAISVMAVISVGVLIGEANHQLSSFDKLFRAEIMISASSDSLPSLAEEAQEVEGVSGAYLAYVATRSSIVGNKDNTVSLFAAYGQQYDKVFNAEELGVDVASFVGAERKAAIGGGLAIKLGLSVGDTFTVEVEDRKVDFVIASLIDTPLTVVFTDLYGLGLAPNVCLADGTEEARFRLAEKYALDGTVITASEAFGYVTDLAVAYMKVFTLFEVLVCLFAFAGYINAAIAAYLGRKRERELLVAAGASKRDIRLITLAENALVVLSSLLLGAVFSVALLYIVQNMLKTLGLYFTLIG